MDLLYDHIQEDVYAREQDEAAKREGEKEPTLNHEIQDAYKAFSASPWGSRIGGFLGNVVKQVPGPVPALSVRV